MRIMRRWRRIAELPSPLGRFLAFGLVRGETLVKSSSALVAALLCVASPAASKQALMGNKLNVIARDYVRQTLEIGQRDTGFVDAYYGPPEYLTAAPHRGSK